MYLEILLDISGIQSNQYIVLSEKATGRNHRISEESLMAVDSNGKQTKKSKILLESWQLTLS
jgi:hypothetical protein